MTADRTHILHAAAPAALGLVLTLATAAAAAADFTGPGTFAFASSAGCPPAPAGGSGSGSGSGTDATCNRIALDDAASRATIDSDARVIRFVDDRSYADKTIVGDVLLQASGVAANGRRVPLNYHVVLSKSGREWSVNSHAHAPRHGEFTDIRVDAWRIDAGSSAETARTLVAPAAITQALAKPALAARLANQFIRVTDSRPAKSTASDITVGIGIGRAALPVMRASLAIEPAAGSADDAVLERGTWQLQLHALTGKIPDHVAQRELFLFGMAGEPLLKPLVDRGFAKGETLVVGASAGQGYLRYAGREAAFPAAAASARRFMQQSFIGLALGWQQESAHSAR